MGPTRQASCSTCPTAGFVSSVNRQNKPAAAASPPETRKIGGWTRPLATTRIDLTIRHWSKGMVKSDRCEFLAREVPRVGLMQGVEGVADECDDFDVAVGALRLQLQAMLHRFAGSRELRDTAHTGVTVELNDKARHVSSLLITHPRYDEVPG